MAGNLTDRRIAAAKPRARPYRLSDGGGLLLVWLLSPGSAAPQRAAGKKSKARAS